ncbi:MAG TPA: ATP-binding protein, partial [Ktedonobacteraceae bacterium]|nr:ATP-binding protein [Ktedonobacteraceae bacterium]
EEVPVGERERIFKTFYGPNLRGGGMGLAICRGIIEAHGGHIRVETAPDGHGSSFVFTLPIHSYNGTQSSADESVIASEQGEPEDSTRSNVFSPNQEPASKTNTIAPTMEGSQ